MKNILEYKGYYAKVNYSAEDGVLFGKLEGINDLVNFESESAIEIEAEFQAAVDDYLEFCECMGKEPDKVYKGTFNVRIDPELHRKLAIKANKNDESLNATVEKAIRVYLVGNSESNVSLQQTIKVASSVLEKQPLYNKPIVKNSESRVIPFKFKKVKMLYEEERLVK